MNKPDYTDDAETASKDTTDNQQLSLTVMRKRGESVNYNLCGYIRETFIQTNWIVDFQNVFNNQ